MAIRFKIVLIVVALVSALTLVQLSVSFALIYKQIGGVEQSDMAAISELADQLISTELGLQKANVLQAAHRVKDMPRERIMADLAGWVGDENPFIGCALYDREGRILAVGQTVSAPDSPMDDPYMRRVFADGRAIVSSTYRDEASGVIEIYVFAPMGDSGEYVLAATLPGAYFCDLLEDLHFWETGAIFLTDEHGVALVHKRRDLVENRYNFIKEGLADTTGKDKGLADFFKRVTRDGYADGDYFLDGEERTGAWLRVSNSYMGWTVGASAPAGERPTVRARTGLIKIGLAFFLLSLLVAFPVSQILARPYVQMETHNRRLDEMNKQVKAANEAKSAFLANMSHEMRTPMNAILGFSQIALLDGAEHEDMKNTLGKIHTAGATLLSIINDILDISKIESGKFEMVPIEYELASLINDVVSFNILRIGEKPVKFVLDLDENLPRRLFGDDLRVKQICNNLLSNAFKYTHEGTVTWRVRAEREGAEIVRLVLRFEDTGIGIREEDMQKLFADYSQVDMSSNRKIEGTGLGLALTKQMAEIMGGAISVESEFGVGTTFAVHLNQRFVTDTPIGAEVAENLKNHRYSDKARVIGVRFDRIQMSYASVLIVDDNESNLDIARGLLKPYKMHIDCVTSGPDAIRLVRDGKPRYAAIFMDHMMPDMDGIEAVRVIREEIGSEYAKKVPIIALTANAIVGNEDMFLANGFQAFLSKPIDVMRMDAELMRWVRDKTLEAETSTESAAAGESEPGREDGFPEALRVEGLDAQRGLERFAGDAETYIEVLGSYVRATRPLIEPITAVTEAAVSDYAIIVHGVKSSSRGICADRLGDEAEALEMAAKKGDMAFIGERNASFVAGLSAFVNDLETALAGVRSRSAKPRRPAPARETLAALADACSRFDVDAADEAVAELTRYDYDEKADLVERLKTLIGISDYAQILELLGERHDET